MRDIKIKMVLNGWIVHCGCQTIVYNNPQTLLSDLLDYMTNPKAKEKDFLATAINKKFIMVDGPIAAAHGPLPVDPPITDRPFETAEVAIPALPVGNGIGALR